VSCTSLKAIRTRRVARERWRSVTSGAFERCSAVDGTWGMKAAFYQEGERYGRRLASAVEQGQGNGEQLVVGDCALAGLRIYKENGLRVLHPVQLLCEAYGLESFSQLDSSADPESDAVTRPDGRAGKVS
jgi:hypothetical protein